MSKIFKTLFNHKWAIILAVLIGIIIAFPQAYFRYDHQDVYQGIDISKTDAEGFYLARIQEVRDGHLSISSPVLAEGKGLPYFFPPLSEIIASFLGRIFFLDLKNTVLLERFLFPALIFLLIYIFVYRLARKKLFALVAAAGVLLVDDLINPQVFLDFLLKQETLRSFLIFTQLISPTTHLLFFFGFLLCFWLFLEKEKRIYGWLSAIILGLSFYTYPYTWTFILSFLSLLVFIFIWQRKWLEVKNIALIILGGLIVALPYFWNLWQLMNHPLYSAVSLRFGLIKTHFPQVSATILLLFGSFLLFFPREKTKRYYFSLALVLTPFVVLNQQIITGRVMLPGHYHWYFIKPLTIIFLTIIIFERLNRKITQAVLVSVILVILFTNGILTQRNSYINNQDFQLKFQKYSPIYQWLNNHVQKDSVILASPDISFLLPVYTSLNPMMGFLAAHHLVSDEYLLEGVFTEYRLDRLQSEEAWEQFSEDRAKTSGRVYGQYYRRNFGGLENMPNAKILELVEQYKEFLSLSFLDILEKHKIRYLVWDTVNYPNWQLDQYSFLKEVYQENNIRIYTINDK